MALSLWHRLSRCNAPALLVVLLLSAAAPSASANPCGQVNTTLNYDDAELVGCTHVLGSLDINLVADITDLTALSSIESIGGSLTITGNPELLSLDGLENLTAVSNLTVQYNRKLTSLTALLGLTDVENLKILVNSVLPTLSGLDNIYNLSSLKISYLPLITNLAGLTGLRVVRDSAEISNCAGLVSLVGAHNLESVSQLLITDNNDLITTHGLQTLSSADIVTIGRNQRLNTLTGLSGLSGTVEKLLLFALPGLTSLTGLERVSTITSPTIYGRKSIVGDPNPNITNICTLCNIDLVGGNVPDAIPDFYSLSTYLGVHAVTRWTADEKMCAFLVWCNETMLPSASVLPTRTPGPTPTPMTRSGTPPAATPSPSENSAPSVSAVASPSATPQSGASASVSPTPQGGVSVSPAASSIPSASASVSSGAAASPSSSPSGQDVSASPSRGVDNAKSGASSCTAASLLMMLCVAALQMI